VFCSYFHGNCFNEEEIEYFTEWNFVFNVTNLHLNFILMEFCVECEEFPPSNFGFSECNRGMIVLKLVCRKQFAIKNSAGLRLAATEKQQFAV